MKVVPLMLREANDFVERWHRHSARTSNDGGKFAIGIELDGQLVGVGIVGRPVARLLQRERTTAELLRCCTSPAAPKGTPSKIWARCKRIWQQMGGTRLVTYTLTRESGDTGRAVGATPVKAHSGQWDTPSRRRRVRAIADEPKLRWDDTMPEFPL
jgi:hypothetical protein